MGEAVSAFESQFAEKIGVSCAVGVANGSDAIALALIAAGVKPGDGVVTTPYTFVATGSAIARVGAFPIFADVEEGGVQLDATSVDEVISKSACRSRRSSSFICSDSPPTSKRSKASQKKHGVALVEDAAQAFGTRVGDKCAGTTGVAGCFSFFPSKTLGAWGDGGAVVSNDAEFGERIKSLRAHGFDRTRGEYVFAGDNSRLDAIQAAVLSVKLKYVDSWIESRRKSVDLYRSHFQDSSEHLQMPTEHADEVATFNPLVDEAKNRDGLARHLHDHEIEARAYYTRLLSDEPRFASSPKSYTPKRAGSRRLTSRVAALFLGSPKRRSRTSQMRYVHFTNRSQMLTRDVGPRP